MGIGSRCLVWGRGNCLFEWRWLNRCSRRSLDKEGKIELSNYVLVKCFFWGFLKNLLNVYDDGRNNEENVPEVSGNEELTISTLQ